MPIVARKVMNTLSSKVSSKTVDFKLRGSKLYLVSEFGTYSEEAERLQWRDKDGRTEVIIPESIAKYYGLREGSEFSLDKYRAFGFRLPSTGLHSGLVFKVKKVMKDPQGMRNNIIIAPSHIVFNHGSDYDIDSLFVINQKKTNEVTGKDGVFDLGEVLKKIDELRYDYVDMYLQPDSIFGYTNESKKITLDGMPLHEALLEAVTLGQQNLIKELSKLQKEEDESVVERINELRETIDTVRKLAKEALKNEVVDTFLDILTDPSNRKWMELPIVMERLKQESPEGIEESPLDIVARIIDNKYKENGKKRDDVLFPKYNLFAPTTQQEIHKNTFSGNSLTGASANAVKVIAYLFNGVRNGMNPKFKENLRLNFNGVEWDGFSRTEQRVEVRETEEGTDTVKVDNDVVVGFDEDGEPITHVHSIWETLDALINAAIDNVKEQILYHMNLTDATSNEFFSMVATGIPIQDVTRFFQSPIISHGIDNKLLSKSKLSELSSLLYTQLLGEKTEENAEEWRKKQKEIQKKLENGTLAPLTSESLEKAAISYHSDTKTLENLSDEELYTQLVVLQEFRKLQKIGESLFASSRLLQILRKFPSTYPESKNLLTDMEENIGGFGFNEEAFRQEYNEFVKKVKKSKEYKEAEDKPAYLYRKVREEFGLKELQTFEDYLQVSKRSLANKILKGEDFNVVDSPNWAFDNTNVMEAPNFRAAHKELLKLLGVMEKTFVKHSRTINHYAEEMVNRMNKKYFGSDNKENTKEKVKNNLMHYFMTGMRMNFEGEGGTSTIFLGNELIEPEEILGTNRKRDGYSKWIEGLKNRISAAKRKIDNDFLSSLELLPDRDTGVYRIVFTADKTQKDLEIQKYRMAFEDLSTQEARDALKDKSEGPLSELQMDLIKYLLLTSGLDFGRTSYAGVIPEFVYAEISNQFKSFVRKALSNSGDTDTSPEMTRLIENFTLQYYLNNIEDAPSLSQNRFSAVEKGNNKGRVEIEGKDIQFDLRYTRSNTHNPFYIRRRKNLYALVGIDGDYIYYQRLGSKRETKLYYFNPDVADIGFSIHKLADGKLILPTTGIKQEADTPVGVFEYRTFAGSPKLPTNVGDIIYLHNPADLSFTQVTSGEVVKVEYDAKKEQTILQIANPQQLDTSGKLGRTRPVDPVTEVVSENEELMEAAQEIATETNQNSALMDEVLETVENSDNEMHKEIVKIARKMGIFNRLKLTKDETIEEVSGKVRAVPGIKSSEIFLNPSLVDIEDITYTVMHELIHIITANGLDLDSGLKSIAKANKISMPELTKELKEMGATFSNADRLASRKLYQRLEKVIEEIKSIATPQDYERVEALAYALTNPNELVAVFFSDSEVRDFVKQIEGESTSKTFWQLIADAIISFIKSIGGERLVELIQTDSNNSLTADILETFFQSAQKFQEASDVQLNFDPATGELKSYNKLYSELLLTATADSDTVSTIEQIAAISADRDLQVVDDEYYEDREGNLFKRVSQFFNDTFYAKYYGKDLSFYEYKAKRDFDRQGVPADGSYIDKDTGNSFNMEERIRFYKIQGETARQVGNYVHKYIQLLLTSDPEARYRYYDELLEIARAKYDENGNLTQNPLETTYLKYIEQGDYLQNILKDSGINFNVDRPNSPKNDKLLPEVTIHSDILGIGTTIDNITQDSRSGLLSILDWKTGNLLSDFHTSQVMRFALDSGLRDSKLNRAKMEVALRAFSVKEQVGDARFKSLTVNKISKRGGVDVHHIELQDYLNVIEKYLKETNEEALNQANEKGLLDAKNYWGMTKGDDFIPSALDGSSIETKRKWLEGQLSSLKFEYTNEAIQNNPELRKKRDELVKSINALNGVDGLNYEALEEDLTLWRRWFGNLKDVDSKFVRAFNKIFNRHKTDADDRINKIDEEHDKKLIPVLKEYFKSKGRNVSLPNLLNYRTTALPFVGDISKKDMYKFM